MEGVRHETEEVVYSGEGRRGRETSPATAGGTSDERTNKLRIT